MNNAQMINKARNGRVTALKGLSTGPRRSRGIQATLNFRTQRLIPSEATVDRLFSCLRDVRQAA